MAFVVPLLVILVGLSGSFSQEGIPTNRDLPISFPDLQKKVFVFPAASHKAFVRLNVTLEKPLTSLTVCLKHHCSLLRSYSLFSYATKSTDNAFLIFKEKPNVYSISVGGSDVFFKIPNEVIPRWEHICVSWNSKNGLIHFWLNGVLLPRMGTKRGYAISNHASIILGQDQDTFGGGFDSSQSFTGDMSAVNMWARTLNTEEVRLLMKDDTVPNPLASWDALNYTIHDYVVITDEEP
ncbi:serum amyloid P-component-like [Erythrolamprus reginae]|uniref:serum amyloid P-component-like n=1 Tax=Erythrolamprus reginae TaxID=121349 RepID=UPI00396C3271